MNAVVPPTWPNWTEPGWATTVNSTGNLYVLPDGIRVQVIGRRKIDYTTQVTIPPDQLVKISHTQKTFLDSYERCTTYHQDTFPGLTVVGDHMMAYLPDERLMPIGLTTRPSSLPNDRYPHVCRRCGAPAYLGFAKDECSDPGCGRRGRR